MGKSAWHFAMCDQLQMNDGLDFSKNRWSTATVKYSVTGEAIFSCHNPELVRACYVVRRLL